MVVITHLFILGSNMLTFQKTIIFIFVVWLLSGLVGVTIGFDAKEFAKRELREPMGIGAFNEYKSSKDFLFYVERYLDDRVFGRHTYLSIYNNLNLNMLTTAFKADNSFFMGKDGWGFLGNYYDVLDYTLNVDPVSDKEINIVLQKLKTLNDIAKEHNIPFVVLIAPNKQSIYPEYLPSWVKPRSDYRLGEIIYDKAKANGLNVVYPKKALWDEKTKAAKEDKRLYWSDDSHWNKYGAFIAFKDLWASVLDLGSYPSFLDFIHLEQIERKKIGDIRIMAKLSSYYADTVEYDYIISNEDKKSIKKAKHLLNINDSFSEAHMPLYDMAFDKVTHFPWETYTLEKYKQAIETLKPDLIIYEIVEHKLSSGGIIMDK